MQIDNLNRHVAEKIQSVKVVISQKEYIKQYNTINNLYRGYHIFNLTLCDNFVKKINESICIRQ